MNIARHAIAAILAMGCGTGSAAAMNCDCDSPSPREAILPVVPAPLRTTVAPRARPVPVLGHCPAEPAAGQSRDECAVESRPGCSGLNAASLMK